MDRGKPGSKIHAMSERGGIPLTVLISAANTNDHRMLEDVVDSVAPIKGPVGRPRRRPGKLHGDKGYDYPECRDLLRERNITPRIARKGIESSTRLGRHRYVIERCLSFLCQTITTDYDIVLVAWQACIDFKPLPIQLPGVP